MRGRSTPPYQLNEKVGPEHGRQCGKTNSSTALPVVAPTQNEGERTDAVVQIGYDSEGELAGLWLCPGHR